ncbi:hypothetical protein IWQ54_006581 [Labrenzia sp. EL_195]|nr:hypothetical protein [Labrenzia sp. EL_195]
MPELHRNYFREIKDAFGLIPTWLPDPSVQIGDIGILQSGEFKRLRPLSVEGVECTTNTHEDSAAIEHRSKGTRGISISAHGNTGATVSPLADLKSKLKIEFCKEGAVFLLASGCSTVEVDDKQVLFNHVKQKLEFDDWPRNQVIVTKIKRCKLLVLLISASSEGQAELEMSLDMKLSNGEIADVKAMPQLLSSSALQTKIVTNSETTLMFEVIGAKWSFLSGRRPAFRSRSKSMASADPSVTEVTTFDVDDFFAE